MADDEMKETEQLEDELEQENGQEEQEEQPSPIEEEQSFVEKTKEWIKDKLGAEGDKSEKTEEPDSGAGVPAELSEKDIPDEFSAAAEADGWSVDELIEFASTRTDDELLEEAAKIKAALAAKDAVAAEPKADKEKEKEQPEKVQLDAATLPKTPEELNALVDKLVTEKVAAAYQEQIKEISEDVKSYKADIEQKKLVDDWNRLNNVIDKFGKEFKQFGKLDDLPVYPSGSMKGQLVQTSPEFKARSELYSYAIPWLNAGQSIDESMANALATYKGKYLEKDVERKHIKRLKDHEQQLSGPRFAKDLKKTYSNEREEGIDVVRGLMDESERGV